jgi:hypothetical protein
MAIVRPSLHRWWMALAIVVGTVPLSVDTSTPQTLSTDRSAVASVNIGGCPDAPSDKAPTPSKTWLIIADRPTARPVPQNGSGPCNGRPRPHSASSSKTGDPVQTSGSESAAMAIPDGSGFPVPVGRLRRGSTHGPHKRPHAIHRKVPLYDLNDDTTSDDPDEDDDNETSKFLDDFDDDDRVAPIMVCLGERAPCPIPCERAPVARTAPPSSSHLTLQQLRC